MYVYVCNIIYNTIRQQPTTAITQITLALQMLNTPNVNPNRIPIPNYSQPHTSTIHSDKTCGVRIVDCWRIRSLNIINRIPFSSTYLKHQMNINTNQNTIQDQHHTSTPHLNRIPNSKHQYPFTNS